MATYEEIYGLKNETAMINKVAVACVIVADKIRAGTDPFLVGHSNRTNHITWAKECLANPRSKAEPV